MNRAEMVPQPQWGDREYNSREEKLCKLLDQLIVLFCLRQGQMDYGCVDDALREIAKTRAGSNSYPVNLSLYDYMEEHGFIDWGERWHKENGGDRY